ncbi:MAG: glycerophosphodiester phosphodiesterase family protein [Planctomycetota bacterium]|jgi:glycerophosphoryl diester phosphodiesterase|nr:glycerophosphodiester phosphodiesterase family protein [Planctomycetota bacterium]MDP6505029.1 glycerophosphodiester phosphodiesterase family protein [Planctomycetota bacterium]
MKFPIIHAHRGMAEFAPENTVPAHMAALSMGFGLEIDLRFTKDRQLVIVHDRTVDRTTDTSGPPGELTLDELKAADAGRWFGEEFSGQKIMTFEETLKLAREHSRVPVSLALDVKDTDEGIEFEVCRLVNECEMRESVVGIGPMIRNLDLRKRFKNADDRFPVACVANDEEEWQVAVEDEFSEWVYGRFVFSTDLAEQAHDAGKRVYSCGHCMLKYEPENWRRILDACPDALLTDYPIDCLREWRESASKVASE